MSALQEIAIDLEAERVSEAGEEPASRPVSFGALGELVQQAIDRPQDLGLLWV